MTLWQRIAGLAAASGEAQTGGPQTGDPQAGDPQTGDPLTGTAVTSADGSGTVAFTMAVIALGAKMAKADGVVSPVEVDAFHQVFKTPPEQSARVAQIFQLAQGDIAGYEVYAGQVHDLLGGDQIKLRGVLECLFYIASADRALHPGEDAFLKNVATRFGFSDSTYRHVRAQFVYDESAPYDVLGLDPSVSDADLKARHRKLVREHHPDLAAGRGLPAAAIDVANRKLAAINAAYETVAKERRL